MRLSIKHKLTIFIIFILLLNMIIVSLFSLKGIRHYQKRQYETSLKDSSKIANMYIREEYLKETNKDYKTFYENKGNYLCKNLRSLIDNDIALYDMKGNNLMGLYLSSDELEQGFLPEPNLDELMLLALRNNVVYRQLQDYKIEYLAPIYDYDRQIGVIRLIYDAKSQQTFYEEIRNMYLIFGLLSIFIVFIIAKVIVMDVIKKMMHLTNSLTLVKKGKYEEITLIDSRDELGDLSIGIQSMALTIRDDIQGIQREKEKMQKLISKLKNLEQKQKHFIGNITHEFKTPITVIKAQQDLATLCSDDTEIVENARKVIDSELQRLNDMVENILYLSSMDKYDYEFSQEDIEISAVIEDLVHRMRAKAQKFGITINLYLEQGHIYFDRDSFVQIMINLIDNAIKYNKTDGFICISSYLTSTDMVIEIEDTGMGIPIELRDKIFDPFYIVDQNRSKNHSGTGLGLPIVQTMLQKQGGIITVTSSETGSCFRLLIPLSKQHQPKKSNEYIEKSS